MARPSSRAEASLLRGIPMPPEAPEDRQVPTYDLSKRRLVWAGAGIAEVIMVSDGPKTLTEAESNKRTIYVTSTLPLTTAQDLIVNIGSSGDFRIVRNETSGGQSLLVKNGTGGTPAEVPNGKSHIVFGYGTTVFHGDEDVGGGQPLITTTYVQVGSAPATNGGDVLLTDGPGNGIVIGTLNREAVVRENNTIIIGNVNDPLVLRGQNGQVSTPSGFVQAGVINVTDNSATYGWPLTTLGNEYVVLSGQTATRTQLIDETADRGGTITNNSGYAQNFRRSDGGGTGFTLLPGETATWRTNTGLTDIEKVSGLGMTAGAGQITSDAAGYTWSTAEQAYRVVEVSGLSVPRTQNVGVLGGRQVVVTNNATVVLTLTTGAGATVDVYPYESTLITGNVADSGLRKATNSAFALESATSMVWVGNATAPTAGQALTAVGTDEAEWQSLAGNVTGSIGATVVEAADGLTGVFTVNADKIRQGSSASGYWYTERIRASITGASPIAIWQIASGSLPANALVDVECKLVAQKSDTQDGTSVSLGMTVTTNGSGVPTIIGTSDEARPERTAGASATAWAIELSAGITRVMFNPGNAGHTYRVLAIVTLTICTNSA